MSSVPLFPLDDSELSSSLFPSESAPPNPPSTHSVLIADFASNLTDLRGARRRFRTLVDSYTNTDSSSRPSLSESSLSDANPDSPSPPRSRSELMGVVVRQRREIERLKRDLRAEKELSETHLAELSEEYSEECRLFETELVRVETQLDHSRTEFFEKEREMDHLTQIFGLFLRSSTASDPTSSLPSATDPTTMEKEEEKEDIEEEEETIEPTEPTPGLIDVPASLRRDLTNLMRSIVGESISLDSPPKQEEEEEEEGLVHEPEEWNPFGGRYLRTRRRRTPKLKIAPEEFERVIRSNSNSSSDSSTTIIPKKNVTTL